MAKNRIVPDLPPVDPPPAAVPQRRFEYEVHNAIVGHTRGVVFATDAAEARAAVGRWLTAGLSLTEAA